MRTLKDDRFIRGIYIFLTSYFGSKKNRFGYIADNVVFTPPYSFGNRKNIFIYDNVGIGPYCYILAINAKFIIKGNCAIA